MHEYASVHRACRCRSCNDCNDAAAYFARSMRIESAGQKLEKNETRRTSTGVVDRPFQDVVHARHDLAARHDRRRVIQPMSPPRLRLNGGRSVECQAIGRVVEGRVSIKRIA